MRDPTHTYTHMFDRVRVSGITHFARGSLLCDTSLLLPNSLSFSVGDSI